MEKGEKVPQLQEAQPEEQKTRILQEPDHVQQEDQLLVGEKDKSAMEEVRERKS